VTSRGYVVNPHHTLSGGTQEAENSIFEVDSVKQLSSHGIKITSTHSVCISSQYIKSKSNEKKNAFDAELTGVVGIIRDIIILFLFL